MHGEFTDKSKPKLSKGTAKDIKASKSVKHAFNLPDCTFEQMKMRCETETTVLRRIMHPPTA